MAAFHPYYDQAYTTTGSSTNTVAYFSPAINWSAGNTAFTFRPPRLRLPPPASAPRHPHDVSPPRASAILRVEAVRRGRAEARPSRALRERRRVRSRA